MVAVVRLTPGARFAPARRVPSRVGLSALLLATLAAAPAAAQEERSIRWGEREGVLTTRVRSGPAAERIDLLLVADGYRERRADVFREDCEAVLALFQPEGEGAVEPFAIYRGAWNVHVLWLPAEGGWLRGTDSYLDVEFPNPAPSNRMGHDQDALRDLLATVATAGVPVDVCHVIHDSRRFGGSAFRGAAISVVSRNRDARNRDSRMDLRLVSAHELGHSLGGLTEERGHPDRCGDDAECAAGVSESGVPNAAWLPDADPAAAPWAAWLEPDAPVERRAHRGTPDYPFAADFDPDAAPIGLFEGAGLVGQDVFRAQAHCLMRSDAPVFCVVCREAVTRALHDLAPAAVVSAEPGPAGATTISVRTWIPAAWREVRWTRAEGPADPGLDARLEAATAAGALRVTVPAGARGAVRCVVVDRTPFVRSAPPTVTRTIPLEPTEPGLTDALGDLPG